MSCSYKKCFLKAVFAGMVLGCLASPGIAAEDQLPEEKPVRFETTGDLFLGYRWVSTDDSLKAAEYIYPESSLVVGVDLLSCPLPYRYHLNGELASKHDFYMDGGFAYKDIILFRDILTGVHHNLNHYYYDPTIEEPLGHPIYVDNYSGDEYYSDFGSNLLSLRLKMPDFPFHTFVNHRHVYRDGTIQQRSFPESSLGTITKLSESRDINWKSDAIKLGVNSHLGPLELEYSHDEAKFDPDANYFLNDANGHHHVIPETESWANFVRMHTSYTGSIVAAATFSDLLQKNNYSGTESFTWKGAFDFSWIPMPSVGFFMKYRHTDLDMDTPSSARPGISSATDVLTLSSRYKPLRRITLNADYKFTHIDRQDEEEWLALSDQTDIHQIDLSLNTRPVDDLKVLAKYQYKNYDNPSYNSTPDNSNMLRLATTYTPIPVINVYLEYILAVTERESLKYIVFYDTPELDADLLADGGRDGRHDRFLASLTTQISPKVSLTGSWFYQRWEIKQNLAYNQWDTFNIGETIEPYRDLAGVPYTDKSNTFSLALQYMPWEDLSISADLSHTIAEVTTGYHDVNGAGLPLSSYSNMEVTESSFSLGVTKRLNTDWEIRLGGYYGIFEDKKSDFLDGNILTSTLQVKRYF